MILLKLSSIFSLLTHNSQTKTINIKKMKMIGLLNILKIIPIVFKVDVINNYIHVNADLKELIIHIHILSNLKWEYFLLDSIANH